MQTQSVRTVWAPVALALGIAWMGPLAAQSNPPCTSIGGAMYTNFNVFTKLNMPANVPQPITMGVVTGDLKGAVSAALLGFPTSADGSGDYTVQHFMVTADGDTINFDPVKVSAAPPAKSVDGTLVYGLVTETLKITGGTGKYSGANGKMTAIGALEVDVQTGAPLHTAFRYSGTVCYAKPGSIAESVGKPE